MGTLTFMLKNFSVMFYRVQVIEICQLNNVFKFFIDIASFIFLSTKDTISRLHGTMRALYFACISGVILTKKKLSPYKIVIFFHRLADNLRKS